MKIGLLALCAFPVVAGAVQSRDVPMDGESSNYAGRTRIVLDADGSGFSVMRTEVGGSEDCTAWGVGSRRFDVKPGSVKWTLDFEIKADCAWYRVESSETWMNAVSFYDADGRVVDRQKLDIEFAPRGYVPFRFNGAIPKGAVLASVRFGVNSNPPVLPGQEVRVRGVRFAAYAAGERIPEERRPDCQAPLVRSAFSAPSADERLVAAYEIEEQTGVDWSGVVVSNAVTGTEIPYEHTATSLTLRPVVPWARGVNRIDITVPDVLGQTGVAHKVFLVGETPKKPRFALRDDGVTLVDGKPFFPIGIYGVKPHARNNFDYDVALRELKSVGMNIVHSYRDWKDPSFMASAERNGLFLWTNGKPALLGDGWFIGTARNQPANLAWYIGDDTSLNTVPQQLLDRDEACRMLDGTRLTCHADGVGATRARSNLEPYVNAADVFMPEIYPFDGHKDERAVAEVCQAVDRCFSDYARFGRPGRARAVWPILQCFDGMSWKRYPTSDEMYATAFAAIIHGGQGIVWFMYGGAKGPDSRYSGMFRTEADWAAMTNLTRRIASLTPVLLERAPKQPPVPEIVSGPKTDPLGQPAVTCLFKTFGGRAYVLAVNAATEPVRVRFSVDAEDGVGKVAWEHREVMLRNGRFEDDFAPLAVHVYRF